MVNAESTIQSVLAERETATEALVEARDLAARVEQLTTATGPGGCASGSMSSCIVSPSLPQVERVSNTVPSVIWTLIMW